MSAFKETLNKLMLPILGSHAHKKAEKPGDKPFKTPPKKAQVNPEPLKSLA